MFLKNVPNYQNPLDIGLINVLDSLVSTKHFLSVISKYRLICDQPSGKTIKKYNVISYHRILKKGPPKYRRAFLSN